MQELLQELRQQIVEQREGIHEEKTAQLKHVFFNSFIFMNFLFYLL